MLLDGHGSCLELPFLQYTNDPKHEWVVYIGVPYDTALRQVGDLEQQNGNYKLKLGKAKENLTKKRKQSLLPLRLLPTDIIPLINYAWSQSFAKVEGNKKAISDREWFLYNRNLLLEPELI